jgi:hypothetical protein
VIEIEFADVNTGRPIRFNDYTGFTMAAMVFSRAFDHKTNTLHARGCWHPYAFAPRLHASTKIESDDPWPCQRADKERDYEAGWQWGCICQPRDQGQRGQGDGELHLIQAV